MERLARLGAHLQPLGRRGAAPHHQEASPLLVAAAGPPPCCLDYAYSFITHPGPGNAVRVWVESRTIIYDDRDGTETTVYQCASCKSEDTFGAGFDQSGQHLFADDNYDFSMIYCGDDLLIFRRLQPGGTRNYKLERGGSGVPSDVKGYRTGPIIDAKLPDGTVYFGGKQLDHIHTAQDVYEIPLDDFDAVRDATAAGVPLVSQTEISNSSTGLRAVIECPVKSMNLALDEEANPYVGSRGIWQTDTGPVAFPDLSRRFPRLAGSLSLGFIAINNRGPQIHAADFVLEQLTPSAGGEVLNYSKPFSLPAKNRLLAIPLPFSTPS